MPSLSVGQTPAEAINQIYQTVLRREADPSGLSFWESQFNAGISLDTIRDSLVESFEAISLVEPIIRLYEVAFGRQADDAGLTNWVNALRGGASLETIAQGFTGSQEFINRFGASTDRPAFVENLYQNGLGRASDAPGKAGWVDSDLTDEQLLLGFSESSESVARLGDHATSFLNHLSEGVAADILASLTTITDDEDHDHGDHGDGDEDDDDCEDDDHLHDDADVEDPDDGSGFGPNDDDDGDDDGSGDDGDDHDVPHVHDDGSDDDDHGDDGSIVTLVGVSLAGNDQLFGDDDCEDGDHVHDDVDVEDPDDGSGLGPDDDDGSDGDDGDDGHGVPHVHDDGSDDGDDHGDGDGSIVTLVAMSLAGNDQLFGDGGGGIQLDTDDSVTLIGVALGDFDSGDGFL